MSSKLLEISAKKLLGKFGEGSHKPGSGSAAAFEVMLAANLIQTVIQITTEKKRKRLYGAHFLKLKQYSEEINKILPDLERLFELDSIVFDKVIQLRNDRNEEVDLKEKSKIERKHLIQLKEATKIPIEIAKHSIRISEISSFVFNSGFQAARGDSAVALNGANSALLGCLAIIDLNLLSFQQENLIRIELEKLRFEYKRLDDLAFKCSKKLSDESDRRNVFFSRFSSLVKLAENNSKIKEIDIENIVLKFQSMLWEFRDLFWKQEIPKNSLEILKVDIVFKKILGYQYKLANSLNNLGNDVAGAINQKEKFVLISANYENTIQNFTAAHELGHAFLHEGDILHRDKPLDGSGIKVARTAKEKQADIFAKYFTMPGWLVRDVFETYFGAQKFEIDPDTSFQLLKEYRSETILRNSCSNKRDLSRIIASAKSYGTNNFIPMHKLFNVSREAMAIRLEELNLVIF